ncbi:MAG TPA: hypothetical protein VGV57_05695 [Thermoleophilaceae bacterium]|nr:hypothetical protein [Thermoleophilaceae bacterium]
MDLRRVSLGERIAAGSGILVFVSLFVDWFEERSAWELFAVVHVLLALLAFSAVALPVARAAGTRFPTPSAPRSLLAQVGVVALTITLSFLLEGSEPGTGIWLCLLAALGILYGGLVTPSQETRPTRRERPQARAAEGRSMPPRREGPPEREERPPPENRPDPPPETRTGPPTQTRPTSDPRETDLNRPLEARDRAS